MRISDWSSDVCSSDLGLGGFLHLLKDEGRNLRRRIIFVAGLDPRVAVAALDDRVGDQLGVLLGDRIVEAAADQALHRENGVFGVGDGLALRRLADQALAILRKGDDRRGRARAFDIFDNLGFSAFHRSEEHTSELQSLMRISYAVFCLKKKKKYNNTHKTIHHNNTRQHTTRTYQNSIIMFCYTHTTSPTTQLTI